MTQHVVAHWEECLDALGKHEADAIGCHWLTAEAFPGVRVDTPFPDVWRELLDRYVRLRADASLTPFGYSS